MRTRPRAASPARLHAFAREEEEGPDNGCDLRKDEPAIRERRVESVEDELPEHGAFSQPADDAAAYGNPFGIVRAAAMC